MTRPYHASWLTQRMANRLPLWADARLLKSSWLQQYLNSIGIVYEDLYKGLAVESQNNYVSTANLDEIDVVYKVNLPRNFNFSVNDHDPANPIHIAPIVTAVIDDVVTSIPAAEDNDINSFWYDTFPNRVKIEGDTTDVSTPIMAPTAIGDLASATINTFPLEGRVSITISDASDFINLKRVVQRGFVKITGTTRKGQEDTEILHFITNTTTLSVKEWRRIDTVAVHGIFPLTATVSIHLFDFNVDETIDALNLYVDEVRESVMFTGVVPQGSTGSTVQHKIFAATNLGLLQQGFTSFDVREQAELLDSNGDPVLSRDFATQPFQDKLFVLGDDKLYIYYNQMPYPNYKDLGGETPDALMVANTERISYIRNQTVKIYSDRQFPTKRVLKNRWTITKPDGVRKRLGVDATEWALTYSGWILNGLSDTIHFKKQIIDFVPDQVGTYTIQLDVLYHDGETQTDKHAFNVNAIMPGQVLDLPAIVQDSEGIAFDSDQNLWIKQGNTAYKMKMFTDNMIVDFERKILYFHEEYDKVTIQTGV